MRSRSIAVSAALALGAVLAASPFASAEPLGTPEGKDRAWQRWRTGEVPHYELPERQHKKVLALLGHAFGRSGAERVVFIDVGCAVGDYLKQLRPRVAAEIFSIGIDPLDWPGRVPYSVFLEVAIASGPERETVLHLYGDADPGASSLQEIRPENVTHDRKRGDEKFYVPFDVAKQRGEKRVRTLPLSRVVAEQGLTGQTLHFVKIDAQGSDFDVFQSLGEAIPNVLFLQLETIFSDQPGHQLYQGQLRFSQEAPILREHGFRLFNVARFPAGPEADVVFVNEKLLDRLWPRP